MNKVLALRLIVLGSSVAIVALGGALILLDYVTGGLYLVYAGVFLFSGAIVVFFAFRRTVHFHYEGFRVSVLVFFALSLALGWMPGSGDANSVSRWWLVYMVAMLAVTFVWRWRESAGKNIESEGWGDRESQ